MHFLGIQTVQDLEDEVSQLLCRGRVINQLLPMSTSKQLQARRILPSCYVNKCGYVPIGLSGYSVQTASSDSFLMQLQSILPGLVSSVQLVNDKGDLAISLILLVISFYDTTWIKGPSPRKRHWIVCWAFTDLCHFLCYSVVLSVGLSVLQSQLGFVYLIHQVSRHTWREKNVN